MAAQREPEPVRLPAIAALVAVLRGIEAAEHFRRHGCLPAWARLGDREQLDDGEAHR
jgi:hypothetical protein